MSVGVGRPTGQPQTTRTYPDGSTLHPNPSAEWLQCDTCQATWLGDTWMDCPWCQKADAAMRTWQAQKLLTPPTCDADDVTHQHAMRAWCQRLAIGVQADLVTADQARHALRVAQL